MLNLMETFSVSQWEALRVADRIPVCAVFSSSEGGASRVGRQPDCALASVGREPHGDCGVGSMVLRRGIAGQTSVLTPPAG